MTDEVFVQLFLFGLGYYLAAVTWFLIGYQRGIGKRKP